MMNEKNWEDLFQAFKEEEKFNEVGYADESEFENLHLYEWLGCSDGDAKPSRGMLDLFARRGYDVFWVEKDSYGWLIGGVREKLVPWKRVITFG